MIRPITPADTQAVLDIWNPVIRDTTITFSSEEKDPTTLWEYVNSRRAAGHDFWVACAVDGQVLGFASYAQFRGGNGYATAMEHSIVLAPAARGQGYGRALMVTLEDHARRAGHHTMFAAVSAENAAGLAFHAALGYAHVALIREAGRKFDRWLDVVLMQKFL